MFYLRYFIMVTLGVVGGMNVGLTKPRLHQVKIKIPTRFDYQRLNQSKETKAARYQMHLSTDLEFRLTGDQEEGVRAITLVGSGDSFTSQWSTLYDLEAREQNPLALSVRQ